jgi:outer membrane receptor protein involved in Fe transport
MKKGLIITILSLTISAAAIGQDTVRRQNLDTATITARRPLITPRIDGFSFDARQTHPAAGEWATDVLKRLPGILVDATGAPSINGSGAIKLFIDGRPSDSYAATIAEALKLIPAGNIARVEIITHPSARYDAEGVDAVINIFTKKQLTDGAGGSLNAQPDYRSNQFQSQTSWRKHHWILNADAGRYAYRYNSYSILYRTSAESQLFQTQDFEDRSHSEYAAVTATLIIDSLTTMNFQYRYGQARGKTLIDFDNAIINAAATGTNPADPSTGTNPIPGNAPTAWSTHTNNPTRRHIHTLNWGLFGSSRNHHWEYDAMATYFAQQRSNNYTQTSDAARESSQNSSDNRELALQADITRHLDKKTDLEAGVKATTRYFKNENLLTPDTTFSNRFYFHRVLFAAYTNYTLTRGDWKIRLGLRFEQTHWPLHFADTAFTPSDYKSLLLNLSLSRTLSQSQTLSGGYARKLIRPYIDNLNPVVNLIDSLNIQYGNPALRPAYSNNYELNYNYRKTVWFLTTTLFLRQTLHSIGNIRLLKPGGIVASTYANIADNYTTGVTANVFLQPKKFTLNWTNTLSNCIFNRPGYPRRRGWEFSTGADFSYKPSGTVTLNASGYYSTARISLQGSRDGWRNYSMTIAKDIPRTGLSISLRAECFFTHYRYITETSADEMFNQVTRDRYIIRSIRIGLSWKFGKKESKTPTSHTINIDN